MHKIQMSTIAGCILLLFVLSVERVVGVPVISFILFYHLFLSKKMYTQGVALTLFALIVASMFVIDPLITALIVLCGFIFLQFRSVATVQAKSWSFVYTSFIQALVVAFLAGIVVTSSVLFSLVLQVLLIIVFLRRVVFSGISQVFNWQKQLHSSELHEKNI